jgi:hypothetical protein
MPRTMQTVYSHARNELVRRSIAGGVIVSNMKSKPVWEKENPKKKSTPLTSSQKTAAKARAKKAGRPYPNLVDNMAASRTKKGK